MIHIRITLEVVIAPLPVVVHPAPGEDFWSWAEHVAHAHGTPLGTALRLLHVPHDRSGDHTAAGVHLPPHAIDRIARQARVPASSVAGTLLARYHGSVLDLTAALDGSPLGRTTARAWALQWATPRSTRYCPHCLAEPGSTWQLSWRLAHNAVCVRHETLLLDDCPECLRPARGGGPHRAARRTVPAYPSLVPRPAACNNPQLDPGAARQPAPCGHHLPDTASTDLAGWDWLVSRQAVLDAVADGSRPAVLNEREVPVSDYMAAYRDLAGIVGALGIVNDVEYAAPETVALAFASHAAHRDVARDYGNWSPCYRMPPPDAPMAAATMLLVVDALAERLPESIEPFVARLGARARWRGVGDRLLMSPAVREAWEEACGPIVGFSRLSSFRSLRLDDGDGYHVGSEHIPHLLPADAYRLRFAYLLPGTATGTGRRFASLAMARVAEDCSWGQAAAALGWDPTLAAGIARNVVRRVRSPATFWRAVHAALADLHADPRGLVDYGARRTALRDLVDIDPAAWADACRSLGLHPGRGPARRRSAAAWLWAELTGGDHRDAPALAHAEHHGHATRSSLRRHYSDFCGWLPRPLAHELAAHGHRLLADADAFAHAHGPEEAA